MAKKTNVPKEVIAPKNPTKKELDKRREEMQNQPIAFTITKKKK